MQDEDDGLTVCADDDAVARLEANARQFELPPVLASLAKRAAEDAGAPLEPDALEAAAALRARDPAAYARLVAALKAKGVRLREWERAIAAHARARGAGNRAAPHPGTLAAEGARIAGPYLMDAEGIWTFSRNEDGEPVRTQRLTNFGALIRSRCVESDGLVQRRWSEVEVTVGEERITVRVLANEFASLGWVATEVGLHAVIFDGNGVRDRARVAIQLLSAPIPERRIFSFIGWERVGGAWHYLNGGGTIGAAGVVPEVRVQLAPPLARFALPAPPEGAALVAAVRAAAALFAIEPAPVTVPLFAAVWRAAIARCQTTVYLVAQATYGKTMLATLAQQHFGAAFTEDTPPASWDSTENALNLWRSWLGDCLVLVDDFVIKGTPDDAKLSAKADGVMRKQHGGGGKLRMTRELGLTGEREPRGTLVVTGETSPRGYSLRTRLAVLELSQRVTPDLSTHKALGREGVYASAMAGFVRWLAPQLDHVRAELARLVGQMTPSLRSLVGDERTATGLADLAAGVAYFVQFAREVGALSDAECEALRTRTQVAFEAMAREQVGHQREQEPAARFLQILGAGIRAGRCHLLAMDGETAPRPPSAYGWGPAGDTSVAVRGDEGIPALRRAQLWTPRGHKVGYADAQGVWLLGEAALAAARQLAAEAGDPFPLTTSRDLAKRLADHQLLRSNELKSRGTYTVRKRIAGSVTGGLLHVSGEALGFSLPETDE